MLAEVAVGAIVGRGAGYTGVTFYRLVLRAIGGAFAAAFAYAVLSRKERDR